MATANGTFTKPSLEKVTLTLDSEEAEMLTRFLGKTQLGVVQELMPYAQDCYQKDVNDALYQIYEALNTVLDLDY